MFITDSECRKKWKLIRDSYNRHKRKQKQSTGSAAPANSKWQFYERLRFLENTPLERQSCTSVEQEQQSSASVEKEVTNTSPGVEHEDTPHEAADTSVHNTPSKELPGTSKSTQERSNIPLSNSSEKPTAKNTKRKRQKEDEFIKFMKDRQENRNRQLESLKSQESVDDISTFTKHIEMMLRKLSARSRAMAKTEIFNIVSKYEIGDIEGQTERPYTSSPYNSYFPTIAASSGPQAQSDSSRQLSYNSNSSYNSYSPISAASSEHQTQTGLIDLTSGQLPNISSEPFQSNYGEIDQNNFDELANLP